MKRYLLIIFTLLFITSCGSDNLNKSESDEFLIIGLTYGFCGGDCSTLFKLEGGKLYADTEDKRWSPEDDPRFSDNALDEISGLEEMMSLYSSFPDYLEEVDENRFGCPDCGDWGALHVFKEIDGEMRYWTLDNMLESNPKEIQAWTKRIQDLIFDLSQ